MKIIYLSRAFQPVVVSAHVPGDLYRDPHKGECRRLTAKRLCLMAERAGKGSDALTGLLAAIGNVAENGVYDGRAVEGWYGLVGLEAPAPGDGELQYGVCSQCKRGHWYGISELRSLCFDCWFGPEYTPKFFSDYGA